MVCRWVHKYLAAFNLFSRQTIKGFLSSNCCEPIDGHERRTISTNVVNTRTTEQCLHTYNPSFVGTYEYSIKASHRAHCHSLWATFHFYLLPTKSEHTHIFGDTHTCAVPPGEGDRCIGARGHTRGGLLASSEPKTNRRNSERERAFSALHFLIA